MDDQPQLFRVRMAFDGQTGAHRAGRLVWFGKKDECDVTANKQKFAKMPRFFKENVKHYVVNLLGCAFLFFVCFFFFW